MNKRKIEKIRFITVTVTMILMLVALIEQAMCFNSTFHTALCIIICFTCVILGILDAKLKDETSIYMHMALMVICIFSLIVSLK